jgi:hypothetical protein
MRLAAVDVLTSEEVQLLADCHEPVYLAEKPLVAERLMRLGFLCMFTTTWQHSNRTCFVLTAMESGRTYVGRWIAQHEAPPATRLALVPSVNPRTGQAGVPPRNDAGVFGGALGKYDRALEVRAVVELLER